MTLDSPTNLGLGAGLLLFAVIRAGQTRRPSYFVWAFAAVMLMLDSVTTSAVTTWIFYGAIALTIGLQLKEGFGRRPEPL